MALSKSMAERGSRAAVPARAERADVERSLDQLSRAMDALVGLIPGVGDFATTAVSFYILAAGVRYRVPKATLLRMASNIAVDYLLGAVPIVGDIFDAAWKSNQMNVELLKQRASATPEEAKHGRVS